MTLSLECDPRSACMDAWLCTPGRHGQCSGLHLRCLLSYLHIKMMPELLLKHGLHLEHGWIALAHVWLPREP